MPSRQQSVSFQHRCFLLYILTVFVMFGERVIYFLPIAYNYYAYQLYDIRHVVVVVITVVC